MKDLNINIFTWEKVIFQNIAVSFDSFVTPGGESVPDPLQLAEICPGEEKHKQNG